MAHTKMPRHMKMPGWGLFLGCLALLVTSLAPVSQAQPLASQPQPVAQVPAFQEQSYVTFRLIPEELWNGGHPSLSNTLPSGKIFLYRAGSYRPELVAEANKPLGVTPGDWFWIAEAGDYVSVVSGRIHYPEGVDPYDKGLIGPVVPACKIDLGTAQDWPGVERLDAVSLDRHAVYPIVVKDRRQFLIPEGRFLAYTMGVQGVTAISRINTCATGEMVEFSRPGPPASQRQDLMVSVQMPPGMTDEGEELSAVLTPVDTASSLVPQSSTAALRSSSRVTFFFLDANAREPLALTILHPESLPHREEVFPLQGGVRELPDVVLKPRVPPP